ncbi:signal transduction histidine kinase [Streptomyces phaeochromogenes]|jgi:signal transduction histidine kinase|uniref:sensor histidine kinase n=1 Tax=Streptomyces phaeochromogenes TaxID=1923 RepID=UPI002791D7E0|nr:ATP-binding protein [Streptomyces phaeochromogenes]MDQ0950591.1 signal transduction histidine kinase [Streptomyces phaeochromogenes]
MTAPTPQARPTPDRPSPAHLGGERPRLRAVVLAPLLAAVPAALAVGAAVALAPASVRVPLAWGCSAGVVLLCLAVAVASRAMATSRLLVRRLEAVSQEAGRLLQEHARLTEESARERARLTDDHTRERARLAEQNTHQKVRLAAELDRERVRLGAEHARVADELRQARTERAAAISAAANTAGRLQALATSMLADLRAMEERHPDEDVLTDLLHLDHRTAQAGRLADSVAVLAGARSGRRWARPIVMESILRGAMGRISGYQRVRVHSSSEAAVAGHAAEGVMHALAEILDNAANFSPPTAEVHVYVEEVPAGVIISVEDSGLVMGDVQLRRAERAVSGEEAELGGLSGTRLGLAVVGRLSRKYGLKVSFRPSARGGTGVLVLIPQDILANPASTATQTPTPTQTSASASWPSASASTPTSTTASAPEAAPTPTWSSTATPEPASTTGAAPTSAWASFSSSSSAAAPTSASDPASASAAAAAPASASDSGSGSGSGSSSESASAFTSAPASAPGHVPAEPQVPTANPASASASAPGPAVAWVPIPAAHEANETYGSPGTHGTRGPHGAHAARHGREPEAPDPAPQSWPQPQPWPRPQESYAAAHALSDLDPEPVPAHGSPLQPVVADPLVSLPKRHRGRTLAEAEAEVEAQRSRNRPPAALDGHDDSDGSDRSGAPYSPEVPGSGPDDVMTRAARFSSFRQAVRGTSAEEPVQARTSPATSHPESDPTS